MKIRLALLAIPLLMISCASNDYDQPQPRGRGAGGGGGGYGGGDGGGYGPSRMAREGASGGLDLLPAAGWGAGPMISRALDLPAGQIARPRQNTPQWGRGD